MTNSTFIAATYIAKVLSLLGDNVAAVDRKTVTLINGQTLRLVGQRMLARNEDDDDTILILDVDGELMGIRQGDWLDMTNIRNTNSWNVTGFYLAGAPSKAVRASGSLRPIENALTELVLEEEVESDEVEEVNDDDAAKVRSAAVVAKLRANAAKAFVSI